MVVMELLHLDLQMEIIKVVMEEPTPEVVAAVEAPKEMPYLVQKVVMVVLVLLLLLIQWIHFRILPE